jgi:hypothetical protein
VAIAISLSVGEMKSQPKCPSHRPRQLFNKQYQLNSLRLETSKHLHPIGLPMKRRRRNPLLEFITLQVELATSALDGETLMSPHSPLTRGRLNKTWQQQALHRLLKTMAALVARNPQ